MSETGTKLIVYEGAIIHAYDFVCKNATRRLVKWGDKGWEMHLDYVRINPNFKPPTTFDYLSPRDYWQYYNCEVCDPFYKLHLLIQEGR